MENLFSDKTGHKESGKAPLKVAIVRGMEGIGMNWVCDLQRAIDYMEEHLLEDIHAKDVAGAVPNSAVRGRCRAPCSR